uniref:Small ribosomal subunit protein bS6m n=1 Tax=Geotrypetes seraphini TaxID=260995 RepID=A0A6P8SEQ7_GEOSA|nr:28S ribosomal protein S6, mitochondrial-like [Geotrypetes seraphini]
MPRYKLTLILKAMQQPETAAAPKCTVEALIKHGAVVRNLENLGDRSPPCRNSKDSQQHARGGHFLVDMEAPSTVVPSMMEHLDRNSHVIRPTFCLRQRLSIALEECEGGEAA